MAFEKNMAVPYIDQLSNLVCNVALMHQTKKVSMAKNIYLLRLLLFMTRDLNHLNFGFT